MKKLTLLTSVLLLCTLSAFATEQTWKNVPLIDVNCSTKAKADSDAHTRGCALQCQRSGFGILAPDGTFLKFDAQGDRTALEALQKTKKTDHLRVTVTGDRDGNTIKVKSLALS